MEYTESMFSKFISPHCKTRFESVSTAVVVSVHKSRSTGVL